MSLAGYRTDTVSDGAGAESGAGAAAAAAAGAGAGADDRRAVWRRTYATYVDSIGRDPSVSAVLATAEVLTGCPVALTDRDGTVLGSSPSYRGPSRIEPPPLADVLDGQKCIGTTAVATPITAPGRYFMWLLDGADVPSTAHRAALSLGTEFALVVKSFALPGLPTTWLERGHLLERMLRGDDAERIATDARRLGYPVEREAHVVVVEHRSGVPAARVAQIIGSRLHRFGVMTTRDDRVVMGVFGDRELGQLLATLAAIEDAGPLRVGVSAPQPNCLDLRRGYEQAVTAATSPSPDGSNIAMFAERDPIAMMVLLMDPDTIEIFVERAIGPLLAYGGVHRDDMLLTLRAWLDSTTSLEALAERLHIHKSTLVYRIRRIKELLHDDLVDGTTRFEIALALRLLDQEHGSVAGRITADD